MEQHMENIKVYYTMQPPKKYTFEQPKVKEFVESNVRGMVLNLFAGKTRLDADETRVDLSDEFNPDYCMDAFDFVLFAKSNGWKYNSIILDPPYSLRKSMEKYEGKICSSFTKIVNEIPNILCEDGLVITCGYQSTIMGRKRGFVKHKILLVGHGGSHHDTIVTVEQKKG